MKSLLIKRKPGQKIFNVFVCLLMSVPFLSIFTQFFLGLGTPFIYIVYVITIILGIIFVFVQKVRTPFFVLLLIPYFLYKFFIDFNYNEVCNGSFYLTLRENLFIIGTFFGVILILNSNLNEVLLKAINIYIVCIIILAPIVTLIQVYNPFFLNVIEMADVNSLYSMRRYSFFGFEDPNAIGFTYVPLAFSFISVFLLKRKKYLIIYLICISIVLILSNSRFLMFGMVLIFIQLILSSKKRFKKFFQYLITLFIAIILFIYILNTVGYNLQSFYNVRLDDKANILARVTSFNTFLTVFPKSPILGIGNEKAPIILNNLRGLSPVIHIGYLNHLVVYGILGSSFLFIFWIGLFSRLFTRAVKTHYWAGAMALIFFFWANLSLYMYSIFFSGFLLCLVLENYYVIRISKSKNNLSGKIFNKPELIQ